MASTAESATAFAFLEQEPLRREPEQVPDPLETAPADVVAAYREDLLGMRETQQKASQRAASFLIG
jgi:hypothetical protein